MYQKAVRMKKGASRNADVHPAYCMSTPQQYVPWPVSVIMRFEGDRSLRFLRLVNDEKVKGTRQRPVNRQGVFFF